jgi:hypothetical protein
MPYGQDAKVGLAFQNSHGDAVTDIGSFYLMPFLSESISPDVPELLSQNMEGRFDEGESYSGARNVGGTISNESQPVTVGVLMKAIFGDPVTVSNSTALGEFYEHTFKPRTGDFDVNVTGNPMTMHKNLADSGQVPTYQDIVCTRLELGVNNGEFLIAAAAFTGGVVATKQTSDTMSAATGKKWTWDVSSIELGGAANTDFANLQVIVDEQASARWTLKTSKDPDRVKRDARRQVRVNGTIKFSDQTEYDLFLASTSQELKLTMTGTEAIRSGYFNVLGIDVPAFKYLSYPVEFADPAELQVAFEGKADYHVGSGTSIEFTLTNTQASF